MLLQRAVYYIVMGAVGGVNRKYFLDILKRELCKEWGEGVGWQSLTSGQLRLLTAVNDLDPHKPIILHLRKK